MKSITENQISRLISKIKKTPNGNEVKLTESELKILWEYVNMTDAFIEGNSASVGRGETLRWEYECKLNDVYFEFHSFQIGWFKIIAGSHF